MFPPDAGRCGKYQMNESNRTHCTYSTLFVDWLLGSTIMYVSDKLVLLTANRVMKVKETNIRKFDNGVTRRADVAKITPLGIENFTNVEDPGYFF